MDTKTIFDQLTAIQSWPTVGLVFALCIVVGYCFKFWPKFPNAAIPAIVIIVGATINLLLAGQEPADIPNTVWHTRQFIVGLIVGFAAWMAHNLLISRLENWLSGAVPAIGALLDKSSQAKPVEPPKPPPTLPVPLIFLLVLPALMLAGCAHFSTKQTDISYDKGSVLPSRSLTTKAASFTFFSSKSDLAKFKALQSDKTQSAAVGSLSQSSDANTNITDMISALSKGAVEGAVSALKKP